MQATGGTATGRTNGVAISGRALSEAGRKLTVQAVRGRSRGTGTQPETSLKIITDQA
jgi:hypothetical protein